MTATEGCAVDEVNLSTQHSIGISAGGPAVGGIVYRKFFENRFGFQTSFLAFPYSDSWDMICGAHLFFSITEKPERIRFYLLAGVNVIVDAFHHASIMPGAGVGVEIALNRSFLIAPELFLAPYINFNRPQTSNVHSGDYYDICIRTEQNQRERDKFQRFKRLFMEQYELYKKEYAKGL